jgi:hypothetical protein
MPSNIRSGGTEIYGDNHFKYYTRKLIMLKILFLLTLLTPLQADDEFSSEVENSAIIADKNGWETEVIMDDGSRCDILNETHAIEVEWATKLLLKSSGRPSGKKHRLRLFCIAYLQARNQKLFSL